MKTAFLLLALLTLHAHADMALNPQVNQRNIQRTICRPGYTAGVRPPVFYTNRIKRRAMAAAGLPWSRAAQFELDHRIPLTLGGAPRAPDNLWLQSWAETVPGWRGAVAARRKDALEVRLNRLVCSGRLSLAAAQACIYRDWQACAVAHSSTTAKGHAK